MSTAAANRKVKEALEELNKLEEQVVAQKKLLSTKIEECRVSINEMADRDTVLEKMKTQLKCKEEEL